MSNSLIERARNPDETIEIGLGRWPLALLVIPLAYSIYALWHPSTFLPFFHWWWSSALVLLAILMLILRNVSWSPFYRGPTVVISPNEVRGRGGMGHAPWRVSLEAVERADWGRNGLFVYVKGMKSYDVPYMQVGPFSTSVRTVARCINERISSRTAKRAPYQT